MRVTRLIPLLLLLTTTLLWCRAAAAANAVTYAAGDGKTVHAGLAKAAVPGHAVALLFHQARGNRHEYDRIAPRLNAMGYDTLAVDQRSGGDLFGHRNATVAANGGSTNYLPAYADLTGAVQWAKRQGYKTIVAVGSSYSASLTLRLAARKDNALTAAAVFSPGEYFNGRPDMVKNAVARIAIPLYITTDPKEEGHVDEVLSEAASNDGRITRYKPEYGVHGASTLDSKRDPQGAKANWASFSAFMRRFYVTR